jgi:hypothetical protein
MHTNTTWLTIHEACEVGAFSSPNALRHWVTRFNRLHPACPVRRRYGRIHREDFERALEIDTLRYTPQLMASRIAKVGKGDALCC